MGFKYFFSFPTLKELQETDLSTIDPRQLLIIYRSSICREGDDFRSLLKSQLDKCPHLKKKKFQKKKHKAQLNFKFTKEESK